jgi:hypothetical protein
MMMLSLHVTNITMVGGGWMVFVTRNFVLQGPWNPLELSIELSLVILTKK